MIKITSFFIIISILCCMSCDMFDTSTLDATTYPNGRDLVISASTKEIWIQFSQEVNQVTAEEATSLTTEDGHLLYDTNWSKDRLILTPIEPWKRGQRYSLTCKGTIRTLDDRSFVLNLQSTFFIGTDNTPPVLLSFFPEQDSIVSNTQDISINFSMPINGDNLDKHISITPHHDIDISLNDSKQTVTITPKVPWAGLTRYTWTIQETITSTFGTTLLEKTSGSFRTFIDIEPPHSPELFCKEIYVDNSILLPIMLLNNQRGVVLSYNESIDFESVKKNISIEPNIALQYRPINGFQILIHPEDKRWIPGQEYTLTQKKGVQDVSGNQTNTDILLRFIPSITLFRVMRIESSSKNGSFTDSFTGDDMLVIDKIHKIKIEKLGTESQFFKITVSESLSASEAQRFISSISIEPIFPHRLISPELQSAIWEIDSPDTIVLKFTGFQTPVIYDEERTFYRFNISGGTTGFKTDEGSYLSADHSIILETIDNED